MTDYAFTLSYTHLMQLTATQLRKKKETTAKKHPVFTLATVSQDSHQKGAMTMFVNGIFLLLC